MRLLELFSGTGSVQKAVGHMYIEVVSIDIIKKFNPTISIDILTWDYTVYPKDYFDTVWASPPCTEYSICKTTQPRNLPLADSIVKKTLEIINYFQPRLWFIENPQTGLLKTREFMNGLPFYDVDYCQYGMPYRKRTRIWTNQIGFIPKLHNAKTCTQMKESRKEHLLSFGNKRRNDVSPIQRSVIPELLIVELFN